MSSADMAPATLRAVEHAGTGWSAWEQKEFLNVGRDWQAVADFYAALVRGQTSLAALGLQEPHLFRLTAPRSRNGDTTREAAVSAAEPTQAAANACALGSVGAVELPQGASAGHVQDATGTGLPVVPRPQADGVDCLGPHGAAATDGTGISNGNGSTSSSGGGGCKGGANTTASGAAQRETTSAAAKGGGERTRSGGRQRLTYQVDLSYWGGAFVGWAFQPGRVTVQGTLEPALQALVGEAAPRIVLSSAGRTDAGVHAYGMPISFYSWSHLAPADVRRAVEAAAAPPGRLRVLAVRERPRQFHATFSATWRRYVYLFPLRGRSTEAAHPSAQGCISGQGTTTMTTAVTSTSTAICDPGSGHGSCCCTGTATHAVVARPRPVIPPEAYTLDPDPALVSRLLAVLEGATLDFSACARDTPPGKDGICTLHRCRAHVVTLPAVDTASPQPTYDPAPASAIAPEPAVQPPTTVSTRGHPRETSRPCDQCNGADVSPAAPTIPTAAVAVARSTPAPSAPSTCSPSRSRPAGHAVRVLCVELMGSRFLRKMVRVLVSTAFREATPGGGAAWYGGREDALLTCLQEGREATAMPAPATGLCFAGAGYGMDE